MGGQNDSGVKNVHLPSMIESMTRSVSHPGRNKPFECNLFDDVFCQDMWRIQVISFDLVRDDHMDQDQSLLYSCTDPVDCS